MNAGIDTIADNVQIEPKGAIGEDNKSNGKQPDPSDPLADDSIPPGSSVQGLDATDLDEGRSANASVPPAESRPMLPSGRNGDEQDISALVSELRTIASTLKDLSQQVQRPTAQDNHSEVAPLPKANFLYNEQKTIEYLEQQLPTLETFKSPLWQQLPFANAAPSIRRTISLDTSSPGFKELING